MISSTTSTKLMPHTNSKNTRQEYSSSPASSSTVSLPAPPSSVKSFAWKDKVIHMLAIRPLKKQDIISRLNREAASPKDRNNLTNILQQVASISENHYKLHAHLFRDLQVETWPFYSESERSTVKRNVASLKKFVENCSLQIVSSASKTPEEKAANKRQNTSPHTYDSKRYKSDILRQVDPSSTSQPSSTTKTTIQRNISPTKSKHSEQNVRKIPPKKGNHTTSESQDRDANVEESPPTCDPPEHVVNYKAITSYQQRCEYKRKFEAEYPEYIALKNNVDAVTKKFIELDQSWRRTKKGTKEYERLQDEIIEAYKKQQKDEKFYEMKRRCQELHHKLYHIKRLVVDYDQANLATFCG